MTLSFRFAVPCIGFVLAAGFARAAPTITVFDVPGATQVHGGGTLPVGMSANGDVTGYYTTQGVRHGFIRTADGQYTSFVAKHNAQTFSFAINSARTVTGGYRPNIGVPRGFVRMADGTTTLFEPPGAGGSSYGTQPLAIDEAGNIAGFYEDANGVLHGFLRAADGTFATFDAPGSGHDAGTGTFVSNMNGKDRVLGFSVGNDFSQFGFTRSASGRKFVQFAYPGASLTSPQAINDKRVITGYYNDADEVWHGFVGTPDGGFTSFDAPGAGTLAGTGTTGYTINTSGLLGGYTVDDNFTFHGFLRLRSGEISPVDIDGAGSGGNQGTIVEVVNDAGLAMGYFTDANGVGHGFLRSRD